MATDENRWSPSPIKPTRGKTGRGDALYTDWADVFNVLQWLLVLASPPLYRTMKRRAEAAHLIRLLDVYITYAERGSRYLDESFAPVPYEQRLPLAQQLRTLLGAWTPPDLPSEITEAARALLHAEGQSPPEGGWDALEITGAEPVEDILLWPEGVPALL